MSEEPGGKDTRCSTGVRTAVQETAADRGRVGASFPSMWTPCMVIFVAVAMKKLLPFSC